MPDGLGHDHSRDLPRGFLPTLAHITTVIEPAYRALWLRLLEGI
jgi:hypothetical protein